jgi:hypothetical protein
MPSFLRPLKVKPLFTRTNESERKEERSKTVRIRFHSHRFVEASIEQEASTGHCLVALAKLYVESNAVLAAVTLRILARRTAAGKERKRARQSERER